MAIEKEESFAVRLAEALVKNEVMQESEAESFVQVFRDRAKGRIDDFLMSEGLVEREDLLNALGTVYNTPSFDVRGHFFHHQWLLFFPKDFLLQKAIIPLEVDEEIMTVVMSQPDDEETLDILGNYVSYNVNVYVGIRRDIIDAIEEYYDEDVVTSDIESQELEEDDDQDDSDIVDAL